MPSTTVHAKDLFRWYLAPHYGVILLNNSKNCYWHYENLPITTKKPNYNKLQPTKKTDFNTRSWHHQDETLYVPPPSPSIVHNSSSYFLSEKMGKFEWKNLYRAAAPAKPPLALCHGKWIHRMNGNDDGSKRITGRRAVLGWTRYVNPDAIHRSAHGRRVSMFTPSFQALSYPFLGPRSGCDQWVERASIPSQLHYASIHGPKKKGRDFNGAVRCKDAVHSEGPPFHSVINEPVETLLLGFTCSFSLDV